MTAMPKTSLRRRALELLALCDPAAKCDQTRQLDTSRHPLDGNERSTPPAILPGMPDRPLLVPPQAVPRRSFATVAGRAALIHALAHIEFNAVNLALDIVWRFPGLPADFYRDWARVAREEALHFTLLRDHLRGLGHDYGDFDAHSGLWDMAEKTRGDVLARLALVARTAEARGLDVSPAIRDKLAAAGDTQGANILEIILRDEIGHVAIGSRWYHALCRERGLDPVDAARQFAMQYAAPKARAPFNLDARRAAGFTDEELAALTQSAAGPGT